MAYKALTVAELLALMKKIQGEKTITEFAADLGISKQYLTDMYNGRKAPSDSVSLQLGFQQRVETRYIPSAPGDAVEKKDGSEQREGKAKRPRQRNSG
jgi:hypothetical protein